MTAIFTRLTVIIWISTAIIASIAGPFGTYASMTLPVRTVYWTLSIGASIVMARGMRMGVERYLSHLPRTVQDVIVAVGFSTMFTVVVRTVNDLTLDAAMRGRVTVWETFGFVLAVAVIVVLVRRVLGMGTVPVGGHPATPPGSTSDTVESDALVRRMLTLVGDNSSAVRVLKTVHQDIVL